MESVSELEERITQTRGQYETLIARAAEADQAVVEALASREPDYREVDKLEEDRDAITRRRDQVHARVEALVRDLAALEDERQPAIERIAALQPEHDLLRDDVARRFARAAELLDELETIAGPQLEGVAMELHLARSELAGLARRFELDVDVEPRVAQGDEVMKRLLDVKHAAVGGIAQARKLGDAFGRWK